MHRSIRAVRGRKLAIASIIVSALASAAPATAEIYKCISKAGLTMYQNFPCQYDSNPEPRKAAMPVPNAALPVPAMPVTLAANTPNAAANAQTTDPMEPRVGMAADEVRRMLGDPLEIVPDTPREGIETWRYINRNLQIDQPTQKVLEVASW